MEPILPDVPRALTLTDRIIELENKIGLLSKNLDMKEERIIELQHYIGFCAADKPFVGNQIKSYY